MLDPLLFAPITFHLTTPNKGTITFDVLHSVNSVISPSAAHIGATVATDRSLIARPSVRAQNSIPLVRIAKVRRVDGVYETCRRRSSVVRVPLSAPPTA